MSADRQLEAAFDLEPLLDSDEAVHHRAETVEAVVAVTDRRVLVCHDQRVALDLPFSAIRRIQLDVEGDRESTVVIVPHASRHRPQVLSVPDDQLREIATVVAAIGLRLDGRERAA